MAVSGMNHQQEKVVPTTAALHLNFNRMKRWELMGTLWRPGGVEGPGCRPDTTGHSARQFAYRQGFVHTLFMIKWKGRVCEG